MQLRQAVRRIKSRASVGKRAFPTELVPGRHYRVSRQVPFTFGAIVSNYQVLSDSLLIIGANDGSELRELPYTMFKTVYAVEPNGTLADQLAENLARFENFKLFEVAAGSKKSFAELHLADNDGQSSSLLEPRVHITEAPHVKFPGKIRVPVERLDDLLTVDECPKAWVIDVQGFELEALEGAGNLLHHVDLLFAEVNRGEVYANCVQVAELDSFLRRFGLRRVLTRWWETWGDALYLRSTLRHKPSEG